MQLSWPHTARLQLRENHIKFEAMPHKSNQMALMPMAEFHHRGMETHMGADSEAFSPVLSCVYCLKIKISKPYLLWYKDHNRVNCV